MSLKIGLSGYSNLLNPAPCRRQSRNRDVATLHLVVAGDADKFSRHIMRIFDSDGNDFLDFKEFLLAMDIATCETEESKLVWAFKLFDNDNSGYLDVGSNSPS